MTNRGAEQGRGEITDLLLAWGQGDAEALDRLMPRVYGELRALARATLRRERPDHTLQPTALVHEAYLRLVDQNRAAWSHRSQFFCLAARQIRRILVDHARRRNARKRGGDWRRVPMELALGIPREKTTDLLALDDALERLGELDPALAELLELRFFGGLSNAEIGAALDLSLSTVARRWRVARARLGELLAS